ncbi:sigma-70 family RNA polymerase sigma factor [Amycolatopsis sp. OK19-0408]|uniref:Sigma-70 family RNA polymerase sigma factor n=1 Tax=Amycolatopsis iheyensis TaxID=2945988 RepID=A0A9X2NGJ7_9PSEU|nr:sigma-70 family RNA polymerase sigma factor [Amycolatopsis iheyensis]MCR6488249.1 sigma-70 family RNA polymerase sigma factor [Amycolatopsis iheyensis]
MMNAIELADSVDVAYAPKAMPPEIARIHRSDLLYEDGTTPTPEHFPRMRHLSAGDVFTVVLRAHSPLPAEYLTVPLPPMTSAWRLTLGVAWWNLLCEAAQFRGRAMARIELPDEIRAVAARGDHNVVFVPRTRSRYYEYAPLMHLLPRATLDRFGLPWLRTGQWPFVADFAGAEQYLPADFETRLSRAWASTVWRDLISGSPISGFSTDDPIRILAHNLDFWLPPVTNVLEQILRGLPPSDNGVEEEPPTLEDGTPFGGGVRTNPRVAADLWCGEAEAADVVHRTIEAADAGGRLRGILEAVRANRVEDDFSERWTNARIDFERKLHHTRNKVKVRFVELTDTIPVQSPDTEIEGRLVTADFMALLDPTSRQIVVLLNSGYTNLTEIAQALGYRNHSPVSKRLTRIRDQATRFFDDY